MRSSSHIAINLQRMTSGWDTVKQESRNKLNIVKEIPLYKRVQKYVFNTPLNFYTIRFSYLVIASFVGSFVIFGYDQTSYLDAIFLAVSATTGTGLFPVSMLQLTTPSFVTLAILMFSSSIFFLLLPPLLARQYYNRKMYYRYESLHDRIAPEMLDAHNKQYRGLLAATYIMLGYLLVVHVAFTLMFFGALFVQPHEPELVDRGYGRFANAVFLTVSAFANAGFSLSTLSVVYLKDNPLAYFILSLVILAGNTAIPVLLYSTVWLAIRLRERLGWDTEDYQYIVDHPEEITSHILGWDATRILLVSIVVFNSLQYLCFVSSSGHSSEAAQTLYGSESTLAGMGYFQTIATRSAGLQIMDLKVDNQGMLVIYVVMMYLSSFPFLGTVMATNLVQKTGTTTERFVMSVVGRHSFFILFFFTIIAFIEDPLVRNSVGQVNLWYIFFECISAYANVGLSLGLNPYSLSGDFQPLSKVIVIFLMMLGKHRLLPKMKDPFVDFKFAEFERTCNNSGVDHPPLSRIDYHHLEDPRNFVISEGDINLSRRAQTQPDILKNVRKVQHLNASQITISTDDASGNKTSSTAVYAKEV